MDREVRGLEQSPSFPAHNSTRASWGTHPLVGCWLLLRYSPAKTRALLSKVLSGPTRLRQLGWAASSHIRKVGGIISGSLNPGKWPLEAPVDSQNTCFERPGMARWFGLFLIILFIFGCTGSSLLHGLSLVAASGGNSSMCCAGFSLQWFLLWSTGSGSTGLSSCSVWLGCSVAHGIFPDLGSNPHPLHWQENSSPLGHQGSPKWLAFIQPGKRQHCDLITSSVASQKTRTWPPSQEVPIYVYV